MDDRIAYLARLGLEPSGFREPTVETLRMLHRTHLERVPFENLDIHLGRPIRLDLRQIIEKVVHRRRGGFCYELNAAFGSLLMSLGFSVSLVEARVHSDEGLGIPFDHLCLLVEPVSHEAPDRFLVDVGFGDSFLEPIPFVTQTDVLDPAGTFRIDPADASRFDLHRDDRPQYRFSLEPKSLNSFTVGCQHHQEAQSTPFTRRPIATRWTPDGRVTLRGLTFIQEVEGERTESAISPQAVTATLHDRFGIEVSEADAELLAASSGTGAQLFDTAIGRCAVAWRENRIVAVALPDVDDAATAARVGGESGVSTGATIPLFVKVGIDGMVDLLNGESRHLKDVLIDPGEAPAFDRSVWELTRSIPPGSVMTYGAMARRLGQPGGAQAVGGAMGRNPIPIIVPCHRVIAADGELGGFSANGGRVTKRRLLEIENAPIDRALF